MSFKAYIDNIQAKTGIGPEEFRKLARAKGFVTDVGIARGVKATQVTDWLKQEFGLGHGHAMAMFTLLKGAKSADSD